MMYRSLMSLLVVLAIGVFVSANAEDKGDKGDKGEVHTGVVVSAGSGKLSMTGEDGKEHSHDIGADVKVKIDGEEAKLEDLKAGDKIRVRTREGKVVAVMKGKGKPKKE